MTKSEVLEGKVTWLLISGIICACRKHFNYHLIVLLPSVNRYVDVFDSNKSFDIVKQIRKSMI